MFKKSKVCAAALLAIGGGVFLTPAFAQEQPSQDQQLERVEVTGSRIKRAAAEGALPVTVISRTQLDESGATTIAEYIRNTTFSSAGQFRPQSGSSAQSFAGVNLRGLGTQRTLVLVDGRRVAKAPNVGDSADMNSIPMAAVERIEILTDGASAVYGSDAIGGVVNIILRKDFDGLHYSVGKTKNSTKGGDKEEASALIGMTSDKGRIIAGVSRTTRDIIYVRDYPWGAAKGASSYGNAFYQALPDGEGGYLANISGAGWRGNAGACNFEAQGLYVNPANGRCVYDFNLVAADEAETGTKSVFVRGEYNISKDWTAYINASNTNNTSFGRYAPVPDSILIQPGSVANTSTTPNSPVFLAHRFAAAGNRDTYTDGNLTDVGVGVQGTVFGFDIDAGARRTKSKLVETGRGFVVKGLATAAINNGTYNIADPFSNSDAVLKSITTTTGRDSIFASSEVYANATTDLPFSFAGGPAKVYFGVEHRKEDYADIYDSLSEAGEVLGSSGSSAAGSRKVDAASLELLMPFTKTIEGTLAGRYEKYSDYGSDFSPKFSLRWAPTRELTLRGSIGRGFAAPSLPTLTQKPAFSADTVIDPRHCAADGGFTPAQCQTESFQINGLRISNPELSSEKSKQWSLGAAWDITRSLTVKADYWNTEIDDVISFISAQTIVNRDNGSDPRPIPAGLSIRRDASGAILQITSGSTNEGTLKYAGLDVGATFSHRYSSYGSFKHELTWSHVQKAETNNVDFNGTWGSPKDRIALANTWALGDFDFAWNINMIGKNGEGDDEPHVGAYVTHDIQLNWKTPLRGSKLTIGAINIGKKLPSLVGSPYDQKPFNYYLYDMYGRQAYVKFEQRF